jgi:hypothetical protein
MRAASGGQGSLSSKFRYALQPPCDECILPRNTPSSQTHSCGNPSLRDCRLERRIRGNMHRFRYLRRS